MFLSDITQDVDIVEGMAKRDKKHVEMCSNICQAKDRLEFARGDYVKVQGFVGPHKGKWWKAYEVQE